MSITSTRTETVCTSVTGSSPRMSLRRTEKSGRQTMSCLSHTQTRGGFSCSSIEAVDHFQTAEVDHTLVPLSLPLPELAGGPPLTREEEVQKCPRSLKSKRNLDPNLAGKTSLNLKGTLLHRSSRHVLKHQVSFSSSEMHLFLLSERSCPTSISVHIRAVRLSIELLMV